MQSSANAFDLCMWVKSTYYLVLSPKDSFPRGCRHGCCLNHASPRSRSKLNKATPRSQGVFANDTAISPPMPSIGHSIEGFERASHTAYVDNRFIPNFLPAIRRRLGVIHILRGLQKRFRGIGPACGFYLKPCLCPKLGRSNYLIL